MGALTERVIMQVIVSSICLKSAVTEPSIMFLTSAKDVAVEYKYVCCKTRCCLMKNDRIQHLLSHFLACYIRGYFSINKNIQSVDT